MMPDIEKYNADKLGQDRALCEALMTKIAAEAPAAQGKVWHGHPVWFIDGNPIVGYTKLKDSVQLMFWSGQSFSTPGLEASGKFKVGGIKYTHVDQVDHALVSAWLAEAVVTQWDYKNIVKRKGELLRLS